MIADQNFYDKKIMFFILRLRLRPKFVKAEHSATAEGENCAYGPTLQKIDGSV